MTEIIVLDRLSKKKIKEKVYGQSFLKTFYGDGKKAEFLYKYCLPFLVCYPLFSKIYGLIQKSFISKYKVEPFIKEFGVDPKDFLLPVEKFNSFNDFFIRKLKPEARPISAKQGEAILPADARYLVYPNIEEADGFVVKGKKFKLEELLGDKTLAASYQKGSMVIARLCPTDYHRFHFPCDCTPSNPLPIEGPLYSVNPLALRKRIEILAQNKRQLTTLQTKDFGRVLFIEVGATCVGSIHQTFVPDKPCEIGQEKGYFSFGGSSLVLLFEPGSITFDQDLIDASKDKVEILGLMGQTLGRS
ncbi:MAG: phosphatidylserine decarboxylase [Verrucomicrobia bacterium]|nr:phosphatidylserine decarboxylase [Verrucomicrobiota bacterium]